MADWACSLCTVVNAPHVKTCAVCEMGKRLEEETDCEPPLEPTKAPELDKGAPAADPY